MSPDCDRDAKVQLCKWDEPFTRLHFLYLQICTSAHLHISSIFAS